MILSIKDLMYSKIQRWIPILRLYAKESKQYGSYDKLIKDKDSNTLLVDIYLERGCTKIDELQSFIKEIRAARDDVIEAEIYKDKLDRYSGSSLCRLHWSSKDTKSQ